MATNSAMFEKNTQVNFKTNEQLLEKAKKVFAENDLDLTAAFNLFVETVAEKNRLPFPTKEEQKRDQLMAEFQKQVEKNVADLKQGKGVSLDEARRRLLS